jgi:hypothetical protein
MMTRFLAGISLVAGMATSASAVDDHNRYLVGKAVGCWATPLGLRGIRLDVTFDLGITRDGHVNLVQIVDFAPETPTSQALALDFAGALKRCGPYVTEGMREMRVSLSWPL